MYSLSLGVLLGGILLVVGLMLRTSRRTVALWLQGVGLGVQYLSALGSVDHLGLLSVFLWLLQTVFLLLVLALWQNARHLAQLAWLGAIWMSRVALQISCAVGWAYSLVMLVCLLVVMRRKQWHSPWVLGLGMALWATVLLVQSALLSAH